MSPSDVIRSSFAAYLAQDRATAEKLIADDFVFTSPQDDHIDRDAYFERCFPTADRFTSNELLHVLPADDGEHVVVVYEYVLTDGGRYRNAELLTINDGQIHEVQVFFGGEV